MAEAGETTPRGTEAEWAEVRRAQGRTVASLNAFSAGVLSEARDEFGYPDPDDAIQTLADEVAKRTLRLPRLLVLDSLVRLAGGRGAELSAHDAALNTLLEALIRDAPDPTEDVDDAVITVRSGLESVASLGGVDSALQWQAFALQAAQPLRLSRAEIDKPLCNDAERVVKGNDTAVGVTVEFHTDASPRELGQFWNPTRWHECSAYQHEMTPWEDPAAVPDERRADGWRRDLVETVELWPGRAPLVTPLRFTLTIEDPTDPDWVHLDYVLLRKTDDILVDEGALDVRRVTSGEHQGRTRVSAKKAILFKNPIQATWPTIACDTFWTDLVIDAAVGCPHPRATLDSRRGKATMADSKDARLFDAIDNATQAAQKSVDAWGELAKTAAAQLRGDSPADTDKWLRLSVETWARAAGDTAKAWTAYNAVLRAFAESAEGATASEEAAGYSETEEDATEHSESEGNGTEP